MATPDRSSHPINVSILSQLCVRTQGSRRSARKAGCPSETGPRGRGCRL